MFTTTTGENEQFGVWGRLPAWRLLLGVLGSFLSLTLLLRYLDKEALREAVAVAPEAPIWLLAASVAYSLAFGLRALAWQRLLVMPVSAGSLFSILQTSLFLNHLLPVKAGEIARPALLVNKGAGWPEAAATTLVARFLDFVALAIIAAIALSLAGGSTIYGVAPLIVVASMAALLGGVLWASRRFAAAMPEVVSAKVTAARNAFAAIPRRAVAVALPLVVASWILESVVLFAAARLLAIEISFQVAAGATAFTILFQVIHVTPGGLGVYETSMTSVLALQGMPA
jgi:uncharacterized protein (TIRG00374 family)